MALNVTAARVEALWCSCLQPSDKPDPPQVRFAVENVVRAYGTACCAARVAQEFGDHPDAAAARMRWAREVVADTYPGRSR